MLSRRLACLSVSSVLVASGLLCAGPTSVAGQEPARNEGSIRAAARAVEAAQLRLRRYVRVTHPLAMRRLDSEIRLAQAELDVYEQELRRFSRFERVQDSSTLWHRREVAELNVLEARLRVGDLREEKRLLEACHRDQRRLLELDVEAAYERWEALAGGR